MSRREGREGFALEMAPPSKCAKFLYYTWKLCSVVFSHFVMISLVVAYCILGAVTFERLEAHYEKEVKMNISRIRSNTTHSIWHMTRRALLLNYSDWTPQVLEMLKDFENALLLEMKVRGWDGNESEEHIQWTFTGALFYSIIVITTIGYGHIAPKTQTGKVVTIFYAILGIPLMLLCLSNIGDVMASSFRFLYWRVCCYVCTRPPKRRRRPPAIAHNRRSTRSVRRRKPVQRAHSDTDFRYRDSGYSSGRTRRGRGGGGTAAGSGRATSPPGAPPRTRSQPPQLRRYGSRDPEERSPVRMDRYSNRYEYEPTPYDDEPEEFPKISLPLQDLEAALKELDTHQSRPSKSEARSKSLPRPAKAKAEYGPRRDFTDEPQDLYEMHDLRDIDYENYRERKALEREREDGGYRDRGYDPEDEDFEFDSPRRQRQDNRWNRGRSEYYEREEPGFERERARRARSAVYNHEEEWRREEARREERRGRDPEAGRGRRLRRLCTVDDSRTYRYTPSPEREEDWSDGEVAVVPRRSRPPQAWGSSRQIELYSVAPSEAKEEIKPVPIWLCVCLVASYIVAGTFLFVRWEGWAHLDAAYFCFITLTTIGFGDFVPAQGQRLEEPSAAVHSIALCSLYLLFGIALLAMSFNLVQEEVRANVTALATKLGIIKDKARDRDSDTDY